MHKTISLVNEYDRIFEKIKGNENFALLRYGDGERSIITGRAIRAQEGWTSPNMITSLGKALKETLNIIDDKVYYGISCPCCDRSAYYWYMSHINSRNITFANLFVNINYQRFKKDFETIYRDAIVIANHRGKGNRVGNLNVLEYFSIGDVCIKFWEEEASKLLSEIKEKYGMRENLLYVISAGPLAEPLISELYKSNPNNCYIDFGSSIDCYIHNKDTRPYTDSSSIYANKNCTMFDPTTTSFDVTVILTTFKKPDALAKQLDAIQSQTLKPKEVFLFQDGINENYTINFEKSFLNKFNDVKISPVNVGVWERFRYAKTAKSEYVCIFDDDTIPGIKWLENCHYHMIHNEGIYGTVGIVLTKPEKYPYDGFFRVGWHRPCSILAKVDFVGHSWFLKKEYLNYMFDGTEKYQKYKYAAEDMCLSFKAKEHNIETFVPPHPYYDLELWGSKPKYGYRFGQASTAISQNYDNCINMRDALMQFIGDGWELIYTTEKSSLMKVNRQIKFQKNKQFIKKVFRKIGFIK